MDRAAAAAWGEIAAPEVISAIATSIEPTDGSMYHGSVAYDHRRGVLLECFGSLPLLHALVICGDGEVDTVAFDAKRKDFCYSRQDEQELRTAWDMMRYATRQQDLSILACASTISARINEQILPKPYFREMYEFMERSSIEGLIVGHSGTLVLSPSRATRRRSRRPRLAGREAARIALLRLTAQENPSKFGPSGRQRGYRDRATRDPCEPRSEFMAGSAPPEDGTARRSSRVYQPRHGRESQDSRHGSPGRRG